ncbi:alcohol dehydrogenase catalytic domain-containing protein [Tunicatimonas pelagia]|uniref:alcohol dehydrogenase catalytic domain-containing protein n=1 Tax=Tunicatimonas pelagia TaxID=931531 RepID=UPI0026661FB6|nr:alcohol dehydrogenase catalytic domain-containing protein [Tunicatimonas pelagia]WKN44819.1 alcohol dehydrogenase catalytic domain-containing protein [Tunicatimonas pelagia]
MTSNKGVVYQSAWNLAVKEIPYPTFQDPRGKDIHHAVIIKVVSTDICGSDQHIFRGRFIVPEGHVLGHEITGEVVEKGKDVEFLEIGDIVSVPFNVSCGRCRNCKKGNTDVCETVNPEAPVGAYGFDLGGWLGGQAEYCLIPYADFQLLKFPDRDQALEKILDLTLVSDILPTGYHGAYAAGVTTGSTVYIAGAGPVGRCAAASAQLLGAACVIVGDMNQERLALVKKAGMETVYLSQDASVAEQIEQILGVPEVDAGVDAVGYEAHGHGDEDYTQENPNAVLNDLFEVVRASGGIGIPGIYVASDPGGRDETAQQGKLTLDWGKGWLKSLHIQTGMAPIGKYNYQIMQAILWDRISMEQIMNPEVIDLDEAPRAYQRFSDGSSQKFVIDPHGMFKDKVKAREKTAVTA